MSNDVKDHIGTFIDFPRKAIMDMRGDVRQPGERC